jgi:hypothetical protein
MSALRSRAALQSARTDTGVQEPLGMRVVWRPLHTAPERPALALLLRAVPADQREGKGNGTRERAASAWAHVSTGAAPYVRTRSLRNSEQLSALTTMKARSAGTPTSIRKSIKISTAITVRNARTGMSTAAAAIDHMAQVGRLLTASRPADTDLGYLAPLWSTTRPTASP